jgi:hypothetical protein
MNALLDNNSISNDDDDEFGGFQGAHNSPPSKNDYLEETRKIIEPIEPIPNWLLPISDATDIPPETDLIKHLKHQLDSKEKELEEEKLKNKTIRDDYMKELDKLKATFKASQLTLVKEFGQLIEHQSKEYETKTANMLNQMKYKLQLEMNEKFENKLAEQQETLIKHHESQYDDIDYKMRELLLLHNSTHKNNENESVHIEKHIQNSLKKQNEFIKVIQLKKFSLIVKQLKLKQIIKIGTNQVRNAARTLDPQRSHQFKVGKDLQIIGRETTQGQLSILSPSHRSELLH